MPPPGWTGTWTYGECQRWLRISSKPGTPVTIIVYPYKRGTPEPVIARDGDTITVTAGGISERIVLGTAAGASIGEATLLEPGKLPAF